MLREEKENLLDEIIKAIREYTSEKLGPFLDEVYLTLDSDYEKYRHAMIWATSKAKEGLSDVEIEKQKQRLILSNSKIGRPRSYRELTRAEAFYVMGKPPKLKLDILRGIVRVSPTFTEYSDTGFVEFLVKLGEDSDKYSERRDAIRREYFENWDSVKAVIDEWDVMGLLCIGAPSDEYDHETEQVLHMMKTENDIDKLSKAIVEIFVDSFGISNPKTLSEKVLPIAQKLLAIT